ncbi:MAG: hypothetical protein VB859_17810 [Planctomycetaceae bacterium]
MPRSLLEMNRSGEYDRDSPDPRFRELARLALCRDSTMPTIKFVKEKKTVEVETGQKIRKVALEEGVEVYPGIHKSLHCPGLGLCTSCRVRITSGREHCSKASLWEKLNMLLNPLAFFARIGCEDEMRLSCQTKVHGPADVEVEVETQPEFNWHGENFWS